MKRNDWIFMLTVLCFSILFYRQSSGLNYFLFSILLTAGTALMHPGIFRKRSWLLAAAGTLASGFAVFYFGNTLAIVANVISVLLLAGISSYAGGSVIISLVVAAVSICISFVSMIIDSITRLENRGPADPKNKSQGKRVIIVLVSLIVVLIFFFMYRSSNVLFYEFTKEISLDFISLPWILFTGVGGLVVYGLYYQRILRDVAGWDSSHRLTLEPGDPAKLSWFDKLMSVSSERFAALVLFGLLNLLLLFVNGVDVVFMAGDQQLPAGISYTEYLHQGVGMLITSIIAAMLIILYFFRGRLHFEANTGAVRNLALLWILQNALMLFSTAYRNLGYVEQYGLTYKRIGVFVYLLLVLIGLTTVAVKLLRGKTNAYLFRSNGWIYFGVLVICSFVNWDRIIVRFNLLQAKETDYTYLAELSHTVYPELAMMQQKGLLDDSKMYVRNDNIAENTAGYFLQQYYLFLENNEQRSWQSLCLHKKENSEILKTTSLGQNGELHLSGMLDKPFMYYPAFRDIAELDLSSNQQKDISVLKNFPKLRILNLRNNGITDVQVLAGLTELEDVNLCDNAVTSLRPLYKLKKLRTLRVNGYVYDEEEISRLQQVLPQLLISYE